MDTHSENHAGYKYADFRIQGGKVKESDWKLFSSRIAEWQENYMNRLNKEYIRILTQDKQASDIFWELDKRMHEDKKKTGVVIHGKLHEV